MNIQLLKYPHLFSANCYLISSAGEYAVIDPTHPYDSSLIDGTLKYVLLTHSHFDHFIDIQGWADAGAEVLVSCDDMQGLTDSYRNCSVFLFGCEKGYFGKARGIKDGEAIPLGDKEIKVIECPGHTIGSVAYLCENFAFVGDTVFADGGHGRCDLPTGNFVMLRDSIARLISLPESVIIYPGHGESTTVKQFKQDIGL